MTWIQTHKNSDIRFPSGDDFLRDRDILGVVKGLPEGTFCKSAKDARSLEGIKNPVLLKNFASPDKL